MTGEWEAPGVRSRRFYTITSLGEEKCAEIWESFEAHLLRLQEALESLHREIYG